MNDQVKTREAEILDLVRAGLSNMGDKLEGHGIILFGSRAGGTARSRSDFDIGIVGQEAIDIQTFFAVKDMLDGLPTLYTFELVDLHKVSKKFRDEALKSYRVLYGEVHAAA